VRFSDLTPGLVVRSPPRLVTQKEMLEFASRYDPQWFHVDRARASEGRWRGLIASSEAFGSPGIDTIKWQHPVRAEDEVALHFEVLRSSKSPSNRTGIILSKSELWNQNDRQVLTLQGTTLFDLAPSPRSR
jgi:acyl dehydratase